MVMARSTLPLGLVQECLQQQPGQAPALARQVRLIGVASGDREFCQLRSAKLGMVRQRTLGQRQEPLESQHPVQGLRRDADRGLDATSSEEPAANIAQSADPAGRLG